MAIAVKALPNQIHTTLAATYRFGTSTQIECADASGVLAGGGVALVWNDTHWCLTKFTGKSTNNLTGLSAAKAQNSDADLSSYDFPIGSNVEIVWSADALDELIAELQTWTVGRNAAGFGLTALGILAFSDPTELTLSSGAVTATLTCHKIQPESGTSDDFDTVVAPSGSRLLFLRRSDSGDTVTVTENGNILIEAGTSFVLPYEGYALFVYDDAADKWRVLGMAFDATAPAAIGTAAAGSASTAARRDHVHAMPATLLADLGIGEFLSLLTAAPSADHWSGLGESRTAGENVALGDLCYLKSDGKLWKAKADSATTMPCQWIALATISADAAGQFMRLGNVHLHTKAPGWTVGARLYVSAATAGAIATSPVSTAGHLSQIIGTCGDASDILIFNPSLAEAVKA